MVLGALSGGLVGFSLGLVGGGGSILAVPLMVYLVGVRSPHVAIGTSALAVAANAALGLMNHARLRHVLWRSGLLFAAAGTIGALAGSTAGQGVRRPAPAVPVRNCHDHGRSADAPPPGGWRN